MTTTEVIEIDGDQAVRLPEGFRLQSTTVSIRKDGSAIVLEPIKSRTWPADFFKRIAIDDPAFTRPTQGTMPPAPQFD